MPNWVENRLSYNGNETEIKEMLEQIRTIDKMRLTQPIGCVTKENMKLIDKAIKISFGI